MSEDRVTIDKIMNMFWDVAGFRADATQTDALQVLLETYAAQQAIAYQDASPELTQALLNSLAHLASQILDTGGRMRLSADGQLDAADQPLALATDVRLADKRISQLHGAVGELTSAMVAMSEQLIDNEKKHARRQEAVEALLDIVAQDLRNLREEERAGTVASNAVSKLIIEAVASRGQVEQVYDQTLALGSGLETLADQVTRMREVLSDAMQSPKPQPVYRDDNLVAADLPAAGNDRRWQVSDEQLAEWLNDPALVQWEREMIEHQLAERLTAKPGPWEETKPASMSSPLTFSLTGEEIADLKADAAAGKIPVRKLNASRAASPVAYREGKPVFAGCFFNDDGTITCRTCGVAKMPSEDKKASAYYKDRQAATGYKSDCKDCEKAAKAAKAAA